MLIRNLMCSVICLCSVFAVSALPAAGMHFEDSFDDNHRDTTLWPHVYSEAAGVIDETNSRLEYTSTGDIGEENMAKFYCGGHLPYDSTWTLTFDAHLGDYGVTAGNHDYAVELGVHKAGGGEAGLFLSLGRGIDEGTPFFAWQAMHEDDEDESAWAADATQNDGSLKLIWNEDGAHLFKAYYRENDDWTALSEAIDVSTWGMDSSDIFAVGLGGFDEGTGIALDDGSMMYADNFVLEVVPEPATLSLLILGGLTAIRRRRK